MKLRAAFAGVLLVLVSCNPEPVPTAPPQAAATLPRPGPTLPPTWTPAPPRSPQPAPTRAQEASRTPTPSPSAAYWPVREIPETTLTPTRSYAVPPSAHSYFGAAERAHAEGDLEEAFHSLDQALALYPEHSDFLALRGRVFISLSLPLEGEADLFRALRIDPFHAPARRALADLYADYGSLQAAAAEYTRYLALAPDDPQGWYGLGRVWERQALAAQALIAYSKTLELAPTHSEALSHRAVLWQEAEDYAAAWSDYTALLAQSPSAEAYEARAQINLLLDAPLMAAADFRAAIDLAPAGTPTYALMMQLGHAYLLGDAPDKAALTFREAISLTNDLEPRIWLGESLLAAGDYPSALEVFDRAADLAAPLEMARALAGRGRAYAGMGDHEAALAEFSSALVYAATADERAGVLEWRSESYAASEQYAEAIADLTEAHDLVPIPLYLYRRGVLYQAAGDYGAAVADLTSFLETADPEKIDPEALHDCRKRLEELAAGSP